MFELNKQSTSTNDIKTELCTKRWEYADIIKSLVAMNAIDTEEDLQKILRGL